MQRAEFIVQTWPSLGSSDVLFLNDSVVLLHYRHCLLATCLSRGCGTLCGIVDTRQGYRLDRYKLKT